MTKKKRICKYPRCTYYDPKAKTYCCGACSSDSYDYDRLKGQKNYKLIVEYDPDNGAALSDNASKEYVDYAIGRKSVTQYITVSTTLLIALFRCAIVQKKIKHNEIKFKFKEKIIDVDKYGMCKEWPKGFGDADIDAMEILLTCQHKNVTKARHRGLKL